VAEATEDGFVVAPDPLGAAADADAATAAGATAAGATAPGATAATGHSATAAPTTVRGQIRGSSLLLVGRGVSMAVNFLVQVAIVRYLARPEYGAFAFALSIADLGQTIATFGLDRTISRFVAMDDEAGRADRMFGTILFATGGSLVVGLLVVLGVDALVAHGDLVLADGVAPALVTVLVLLAPVNALDTMLTALLSVFASPRSIFVRRFVVAPALRLAVVAALIVLHADVNFLAAGYVIAGVAGLGIYIAILGRVFARRGLLVRLRPRQLDIPVRELLAFTIPLLTTDLVYIVLNTSDAILLGLFHGADDVAAFRVVVPAAGLNQLVFQAFTLLFVPAASRLYARRDFHGIRDLYWQTAIWMTVVSFPLFALTFSLAGPLTVALYEPRYASSAPYLAMLSLGYFFNTALGFNGLTLRVFGDLRYIVTVNVAAAVMNLGLNLLLIPPFGPAGAAVGTMTTLLAHNVLKQAGLRRLTGIDVLDRGAAAVYAAVTVAAGVLLAVQLALGTGIVVSIVTAGVVSLALVLATRRTLHVAETFPEIARLPFARRLFG
jgi:O-antigen/teichoic acid export membrane protein